MTKPDLPPSEELRRLRAVAARLTQMTDYWEQQLPEVIRTPAVVSAIRAALEAAAVPPAPAVPVDRAALREVAAQAIRDSNGTPEALAWWRAHPQLIPAHVYADAVLDVLPELVEDHRLTLSMALGLGTGAPWDAIHDRATELGLPPLNQDPVARRLGLLPAPSSRSASLTEAADGFDRHAARILDGVDDKAVFVAKALREQAAVWSEAAETLRRLAAEGPLSPFYEHPECGFHWHGRDGMDIPMRDGQPVCPRCELRRLAAEAHDGDTQAVPVCVCGHPMHRHHEDVCLTGCGCNDGREPGEVADLPGRLAAALTARFTELGNPFSEMRYHEQGPDGWPASHPVGPNRVAEVLRELMAAAPAVPLVGSAEPQDETDARRAPDPECERCDGSGLDPDAYFVNRETQTWTHAPCSECLPEDDDDSVPTNERVRHSGPDTKFCVLCLSGEHEHIDGPGASRG